MFLVIERLKLAIEENFAKRLLAATGGRHVNLRVFHTIRRRDQPRKRPFCNTGAQSNCSNAAFPVRGAWYVEARPVQVASEA